MTGRQTPRQKTRDELICRGCGRPIARDNPIRGHSDNCPFWGSIENARIDRNSLHELLRTNTPPGVDPIHYQNLRAAAYEFSNAILAVTVPGVGQQVALRRLRDALIAANASMPSLMLQEPPKPTPAALGKRRKTKKR
jgi:hypothetical protein